MTSDASALPGWIVLGRQGDRVAAAVLDPDGAEVDRVTLTGSALAHWVADMEATASPRWVWNDAPRWYPQLLAAGVRLARCHDLRLVHAILRRSQLVTDSGALRTAAGWDAGPFVAATVKAPALFELDATGAPDGPPDSLDAALGEWTRQRDAVATSRDPARLRLLVAAESAGALIAEELRAVGLPWDAQAHGRILTETLGECPPGGGQPSLLAAA
ncbi:MAG: bifunctional 3'-5' exonuclease/DNA polymerase, partial [Microbacterium sp.]